MEQASTFVEFAVLDPEEAKKLAPGVELLVSTHTFSQIAAEKFHAQRLSQATSPASHAPVITVEQVKSVRAVVMASPTSS